MNPQAVEVGREARLLAGHAVVADQRQTQPAADSRALHHRDQRLAGAEHAYGVLVQAARELRIAGFFRAGEVGAGAEGLALGLEDHHAAFRQLVEMFQRGDQIHDQVLVEEIQRRTAEFQGGDMALQFELEAAAGYEGIGRGHAGSITGLDAAGLIPAIRCC
ncbi:hypothetical protein D3C78_859590 [compost metagenome]